MSQASTAYWNNPNLNYEPPELAGSPGEDLDVFVVDDFLDDPLAVRNLILGLDFEAPPRPETEVISFNGRIPDSGPRT